MVIFSIEMEEAAERFVRWMDTYVGIESQHGRFRNVSHWARVANVPISTMHRIYESGTADPPNLIKIGKAVGKSPKEMFELAGWLDPEPTEHPPERETWCRLYDDVPLEDRPALLETARLLVRGFRAPEDRFQA